MSKDKLIPELRFPEFEGDGEWIYKRLGETGKIITGKTPSTKDASLWNGEILFITPTDIDENQKYQLVTNRTIIRNRKLNILPEGSIAYTCIASIGKMSITAKESVTNQQINSIVVNANYHNEFIYYSLLHITPFIKSRPATSTLPIVNKTEFSAFRIGVPIPQEQQKIASCLSSLDELIAAHNDKLDALKDHKKGLLQNLFPQEGETVPKVRFPEFEGDGEWVEETIDSVSLLVTDYVANGSFQSLRENVNVSNQKGYAYYVRLVDLRAGLGHTDQKFVDQSSYQFLGKSSLNGGELLMANIGANVGEVWQMPIVDYPATLAPNMLMIKFESQTTTDFVFQFLQSGYGQRNLSLAISGSGHPKINKTDLKQVNVGIPPTRDEQQKIASCLSAVDELITAQQEKIDELQQHKKGLMQGLFPKIES